MPQRKSASRLGHGRPASLSIAKSAEAAKGSATQHSPKQLSQSAFRDSDKSRGLLLGHRASDITPAPRPRIRGRVTLRGPAPLSERKPLNIDGTSHDLSNRSHRPRRTPLIELLVAHGAKVRAVSRRPPGFPTAWRSWRDRHGLASSRQVGIWPCLSHGQRQIMTTRNSVASLTDSLEVVNAAWAK